MSKSDWLRKLTEIDRGHFLQFRVVKITWKQDDVFGSSCSRNNTNR